MLMFSRKRLAPPGRLLETGCSSGLWVLRLARKGCDIMGLDLAGADLKIKHPTLHWVAGDVRKTEFQCDSFDGNSFMGAVEDVE